MPTVIDGITGINRITGGADVGGNLDFIGTGNRITGDFSNATAENRLMFQTSTPNTGTGVRCIPNGSSALAAFACFNSSTPSNSAFLSMAVGSVSAEIATAAQGSGSNLPLTFAAGGAERMRLTTNGDLWINNTSAPFPGSGNTSTGTAFERAPDGTTLFLSRANNALLFNNRNSDGAVVLFNRSGVGVGNIVVTTTNTTYNTSSDYRLKENIRAMVAPLERLLRLKPVLFNWKIDGSEGEGFIAHQLQQEVPMAVSGEKDGKEMQGVDASKVVPLLVAAVQELAKEVAELKARLA